MVLLFKEKKQRPRQFSLPKSGYADCTTHYYEYCILLLNQIMKNKYRSSKIAVRQSSRQSSKSSFGFRNLDVYQTLIEACGIVHTKIIPALPESERFGLKSQLLRSSKSPIALLAEGHAKQKHQKAWIKYLEDCIGECNETIAHLDMSMRSYPNKMPKNDCLKAIDLYDKASRQLYKLGKAWKNQEDDQQ